MEKVFQKQLRIHFVDDPKTVSFFTRGTWGSEDNIQYKFVLDSFKDIIKFNGCYVVKYNGKLLERINMVDKYGEMVSDETKNRYKNKEKRKEKLTYDLLGERVDICEACGKFVWGVAVSDLRITQIDHGIKMCKDCYMRYNIFLRRNDEVFDRGTLL